MGKCTSSQMCARCDNGVIAHSSSCACRVFAGCKPLLDKTLGILIEGLIDTLLSLFHENKERDLRSLDANGFCQLMLEALIQQDSSELLQAELERTRINTTCFIESFPLDMVPESAKASIRGSMDSPSRNGKPKLKITYRRKISEALCEGPIISFYSLGD